MQQGSFSHLHHLFECFHILLHAVMGAQVGHKVARVHAVEAVEERIDASMEVD